MFLTLLSWATLMLYAFCGLMSFAVGLYYLAELVEEYTVTTGRLIRYIILLEIGLHFFLFFENIPWTMIIMGIAAHVYYMSLLKTYPAFQFASPPFIGTVVFIILLHVLAFRYFGDVWYPFSEVLAYFTVFIWLVPFMFLLSLSANELVLPQTMSGPNSNAPVFSTGGSDFVSSYLKGKRKGLFYFLTGVKESVLPTRIKKGY